MQAASAAEVKSEAASVRDNEKSGDVKVIDSADRAPAKSDSLQRMETSGSRMVSIFLPPLLVIILAMK